MKGVSFCLFAGEIQLGLVQIPEYTERERERGSDH